MCTLLGESMMDYTGKLPEIQPGFWIRQLLHGIAIFCVNNKLLQYTF